MCFRSCLWHCFKWIVYLCSFKKHEYTNNSLVIIDKSPELKELLKKNFKFIILSNNHQFNLISNPHDVVLETLQTDYVFTYFVLNLQKKVINIKLNTEHYSYYVDGNILDNDFIVKYAKKHENIDLRNKHYQIELMDQHLQKLILTQDHSILLEKDNYKII